MILLQNICGHSQKLKDLIIKNSSNSYLILSCDNIYNIPDFINKKKGVAQGYGVKYDFT